MRRLPAVHPGQLSAAVEQRRAPAGSRGAGVFLFQPQPAALEGLVRPLEAPGQPSAAFKGQPVQAEGVPQLFRLHPRQVLGRRLHQGGVVVQAHARGGGALGQRLKQNKRPPAGGGQQVFHRKKEPAGIVQPLHRVLHTPENVQLSGDDPGVVDDLIGGLGAVSAGVFFGIFPHIRPGQQLEKAQLQHLGTQRKGGVEAAAEGVVVLQRQPGDEVDVQVQIPLFRQQPDVLGQLAAVGAAVDGRQSGLVEALQPDLQLHRPLGEGAQQFQLPGGEDVPGDLKVQPHSGGDAPAVFRQHPRPEGFGPGGGGVEGAVYEFDGPGPAGGQQQNAVFGLLQIQQTHRAAPPRQAEGAAVGAAPAGLDVGDAPAQSLQAGVGIGGRSGAGEHCGLALVYALSIPSAQARQLSPAGAFSFLQHPAEGGQALLPFPGQDIVGFGQSL